MILKNLKRSAVLFAWLSFVFTMVHCGGKIEEEAATSMKNYSVTVLTKPSPIPVNELFTVNLKVTALNESGHLPDGIEVSIDGIMPAHHHGMNVNPEIKKLRNGEYEVEGMLFHMPGDWQIKVYIEHNSKKEVASFDYVI